MTRRRGPRRLLVVTADDYGLTEGVSRAILAAHHGGVVTSTSVLALGPAFATTARWLHDAPDLGIGAHLALVGEDPPLLPATEVPTLVDRRGRLHRSWRTFLPAVATGRIDPGDVLRELRAQLAAVRAAGLEPDHLDTHQNLHLWPAVGQVVRRLGEESGIRSVRVPGSTARSPVGVAVRHLAARLHRSCEDDGWTTPQACRGLDTAGALDRQRALAVLDELAASPARTAELAAHPGEADDPDLARYRWGYRWGDELEALRSPELRRAVEDRGFRLGTFADLPPAVIDLTSGHDEAVVDLTDRDAVATGVRIGARR